MLSPSQQQIVFSYNPNENDELREHELILMILGLTTLQGITLLHIQTGETINATLSYMTPSDRPVYTHFKD